MISPSDEHVMELEEFKFFEFRKPRKEASFNKDKSGRDLQFHKYTRIHRLHLNALDPSCKVFNSAVTSPCFYFSVGED